MNRPPDKRKPSSTQSAAQQAVLNKLRSGGTIQGAQPNNPLAYAAQFFDPRRFFDSKPSAIPTLKGGMVNGREALIAPGGWNQGTAGLGEITVGGQRFFPAQSGKDLVYQRAPGQIGGQYGSIRVPDQLASSVETPSNPEERAYQQEKARVTQMTEQDPMFKKYKVAELTKAYNTASPEEKNKIGLQIWAATNPTLAKKVPAGQVGYQTSASMFGSQAFGTDIPGVTETIYSQAGQQEGVPGGVKFPGSEQAAKMNSFSMGADAQQLGVTPPGTTPFPMIGENVFKRGFEVPSSEDLSQTQLALLKRAFESRIK
jgi:hypothetical protein